MFTALLAPAHWILTQTHSAPFVSLVLIYKDFWEGKHTKTVAMAEIKLTKSVGSIARREMVSVSYFRSRVLFYPVLCTICQAERASLPEQTRSRFITAQTSPHYL